MNHTEKLYSLLAMGYLIGLVFFLITLPAVREMKYLLPLSLLGVAVNAGLLFVVFKDIFSRSFPSPWQKFFWMLIVFFCLPAVIIYLPLYGFKKR